MLPAASGNSPLGAGKKKERKKKNKTGLLSSHAGPSEDLAHALDEFRKRPRGDETSDVSGAGQAKRLATAAAAVALAPPTAAVAVVADFFGAPGAAHDKAQIKARLEETLAALKEGRLRDVPSVDELEGLIEASFATKCDAVERLCVECAMFLKRDVLLAELTLLPNQEWQGLPRFELRCKERLFGGVSMDPHALSRAVGATVAKGAQEMTIEDVAAMMREQKVMLEKYASTLAAASSAAAAPAAGPPLPSSPELAEQKRHNKDHGPLSDFMLSLKSYMERERIFESKDLALGDLSDVKVLWTKLWNWKNEPNKPQPAWPENVKEVLESIKDRLATARAKFTTTEVLPLLRRLYPNLPGHSGVCRTPVEEIAFVAQRDPNLPSPNSPQGMGLVLQRVRAETKGEWRDTALANALYCYVRAFNGYKLSIVTSATVPADPMNPSSKKQTFKDSIAKDGRAGLFEELLKFVMVCHCCCR